MDKASSSARTKTKAKGKTGQMSAIGINDINEDLLHKILAKLPARWFASAACVSKSFNRICNRILSRPKLSSAISLNPSLPDAIKEVLDKVLSEPIRPHFAIANVGSAFDLTETLQLISKGLGSCTPLIVSETNGIIGRDALTNEFEEVKWGALFSDYAKNINTGILLTVGFLPGLKVDVIPLRRPTRTSQASAVDKFVMDIKEYAASVSRYEFPVGIILFGESSTDMKLVLETMDYAMPMDTVIVGDERGCFIYRSGNTRISCRRRGYLKTVALVFAQDRDRPSEEIRLHVALSNGVLPVGPVYKAVSVRTSGTSTWLTARREGQQEILDGQNILDGINNEMEDCIESPNLFIGVTKSRKFCIGSEKPSPRTYMALHEVVDGDDEYLFVDGVGIKTGDTFQFYHSDLNTALASCARVSDKLKNLKLEANPKNNRGDGKNSTDVFGGFIFACYGRGESFFGQPNVDSSPFSENFPGVPLAGIFCNGEISRPSSTLAGPSQGGSSVSCCLHVYSSVYLTLSYTPLLEN